MVEITLSDFIGYNREEIHKSLLIQKERYFEIGMLLYPYPTPGNPSLIQSFYAIAGYVGQLLKKISKSFAYSVPGIAGLPFFKFRVRVSDMKALAEILYKTVHGAYGSNELFDDFHNGKDAFWSALHAHTVKPAAWGLLHVANFHSQVY